jgi:uncharacterized membrane protein YadS
MPLISSTKLAASPNDRASARPSVRRWTGRPPRLFRIWVIAGKVIGIGGGGLGIVVATVRACFAATIWMGELLGVEPTLAQLIAAGASICGASAVIATGTPDEDVAYAVACITVFGSAAMFAHPIPADAKAWIVVGTTFLQSIAPAAMRLETNIGRLTANHFRPALLGILACLLTAGFSLTLIELME